MDIPEYAISSEQKKYYHEVIKFDKSLGKRDRKEIEKAIALGYSIDRLIALKKMFPNKTVKECIVFDQNPDNWVGTINNLGMFLYSKRHVYIRTRFFENFDEEEFNKGRRSFAQQDFLSALCGVKWTWFNDKLYGAYEHDNNVIKLSKYTVKAESNLSEYFIVYASSPDEAVGKYYEMSATGVPKLKKEDENKTIRDVSVLQELIVPEN